MKLGISEEVDVVEDVDVGTGGSSFDVVLRMLSMSIHVKSWFVPLPTVEAALSVTS